MERRASASSLLRTGETADDRIERLVYEFEIPTKITVATSDFAEQQVTFGGGRAPHFRAAEFVRQC